MVRSLLFSTMAYPNLKRLAELRPIVLGSGSPRRLQLLQETGISFRQIIPDIHESPDPNEQPYAFAKRLAEDKARAVTDRVSQREIVIGCDTIVVLEEVILGKPAHEAEAFEILSRLSGKRHVVCSAVAMVEPGRLLASDYELTTVSFNEVTAEQIRGYISTGEPMDKAGAYGIQGMGSFLVDTFEGNLDTVVGLPRVLVERLAGEVLSLL